MKHSIEELVNVVYRYYPRGVTWEDPGRPQTAEIRRLVEARRRAGADCDHWLGMLRRLRDQFPENGVGDSSVHLVMGTYDACYSGHLYLPDATSEHWHTIEFRVSILVPYYIAYSSRVVDDLKDVEKTAPRATPSRFAHVIIDDTFYFLPAILVPPEFLEPPPEMPARRKDISFEPSPDERPYAEWIARDIEATWGYERMPPEVGKVIVPDVATSLQTLGDATLYDCLLSDDW